MDMNLLAVWSERIQAFQASGQTMKAWCAEQNLTVHQLKYWLYNAQRKVPAASTTTFRPVVVSPQGTAPDLLHSQMGALESRVARVEVRSGLITGLLGDLVEALSPLC
ncbi:IS66 family insertion sequence element accessory protein TnpA [Paenibacillus ferrarius]|uniref:IS66 family insertion sequence element accessory protein TnpA n=1 Tax=Paenibacillus ferrarius TaxID=1469647 RepID=UPI003D26FADD